MTSCRYCEQASHDHHCNKFPWRRIETKTDSEYGKKFNACERVIPKSKIKSDDYDSRTITTFAKFSSKVCFFPLLCRTTPSRLKQKAAQTQHISMTTSKLFGEGFSGRPGLSQQRGAPLAKSQWSQRFSLRKRIQQSYNRKLVIIFHCTYEWCSLLHPQDFGVHCCM